MPHGPQIPLTPQTDERNFPRWSKDAKGSDSGAQYPKMLTRLCTRADLEEWRQTHGQFDPQTQRTHWNEAGPRIGSQIPRLATPEMVDAGLAKVANEPIIVDDKEMEAKVNVFLGLDRPAPPPPTVSIPLKAEPTVQDQPTRRRRRRRMVRPPEPAVEPDGWVEE